MQALAEKTPALFCQPLTFRPRSHPHLARWTQDLRCPSLLVQAGRAMNPVVGKCHRLGQEEDLNRSRAWSAEELS